MIKYSNYKYIIIGFICVLIFSSINICLISANLLYKTKQENKNSIQKIEEKIKTNNLNVQELNSTTINIDDEKWKIIIPKIELEAQINEGTSQEVIAKTVGHFEQTSIFEGNIGLAAHNSGKGCDYFKNLKKLKTGDEIIYVSKYGTKYYEVSRIQNIDETDWTYLQQTKDNRITLITCIENTPNMRLCIQGVESNI